MPFGGPNASKTSKGFTSLKTEPGIGISSFKKTKINFSTVHAIFAHISSINEAWQKKFLTKSPKFRSRGYFFGKKP
jgi:hypothetical protein